MYLVIYLSLIYYLCRIIVISIVASKVLKKTVKKTKISCTFFNVSDPMNFFFNFFVFSEISIHFVASVKI